MPVIWAIQIINFINVLAGFVAWMPAKYLGQRSGLLTFHGSMLIVHLMTVFFISMDIDIGVVVCISLYLCCFNAGIGGLYWVHATETTVDAINGLAILNVFFMMMVLSVATPLLIYHLGVKGIFMFHAATCTAGLLYMSCVVKDTSGKWKNGEWQTLTEKEKKNLYASLRASGVNASEFEASLRASGIDIGDVSDILEMLASASFRD